MAIQLFRISVSTWISFLVVFCFFKFPWYSSNLLQLMMQLAAIETLWSWPCALHKQNHLFFSLVCALEHGGVEKHRSSLHIVFENCTIY